MNKPSESSKRIAKAAAAAFGGSPTVNQYWDDGRSKSVAILSCTDSPCQGVTSYATIGVSEIPIMKDGKALNVRAELVGACGSHFTDFGNYLSTAAFCVINSRWFVAPGTIFPQVLSMYREGAAMKHFLFLPPFLWEDRLQTLRADNLTIAWLLAIPISDEELTFAENKGVPELEVLFEKHQIDIFDLERPSVI